MNVLLFAIGDQVIALEERVALDLVNGRDDAGGFNQCVELSESIVAIHNQTFGDLPEHWYGWKRQWYGLCFWGA